MSNVILRKFEKFDRDAVRSICCDTADCGSPIDGIFSDRQLAADLLCSYYTDYEQEAAFVAESDGRVIGYALGCMDNRRYGLVMFWILIPKALLKAFKRGSFFSKAAGGMFFCTLLNWNRIFEWRKNSFHSHQGHLHIGIAKDSRGQEVGQKLIGKILEHSKECHLYEMTASIQDSHTMACSFFEQQGFEIKEKHPMSLSRDGEVERYHSLLYVKKVT
jgi:ribosomal protein S18 acetylase RimI-like enzyme